MSSSASPRKRIIVRVIWIVVACVTAAAFATPVITGFKESWAAIHNANWWLLSAALVAQVLSFVSFALLSRGLLRPEERPRFSTLMKINVTGNGVSHVLPGGGPAAAALRFTLLDRAGVAKSSAVGVAALESAVQIVWYVAAFAFGMVLVVPSEGTTRLIQTAVLVAVVLTAALIGGFVVLMIKPDEIVEVVHAIARRIRFLPEDKLRRFTEDLVGQMRVLGTNREARNASMWHGGGFWFFNALTLYLCIAAIGPRPPVGAILAVFGIVNLLALLPLTPGGLGIVEGVAVPTLVAFGVPASVSVLGVLAWRFFQFWLPIPIGGLTWIWLELKDYRVIYEDRAHKEESS